MITIGGKDIADIVIDNKNVVKIQDAITLDIMWEKTSQENEYFYVENTYNGNNSIELKMYKSGYTSHTTNDFVSYSYDKENWTSVNVSTESTTTIPMTSGQKVYMRNDRRMWNPNDTNFVSIYCTKTYNVGGDILSLVDYTDSTVTLTDYCFQHLFVKNPGYSENNNNLINASDLIMPSSVSRYCFSNMFDHCRNLISAPSLPAMTLANSCYDNMFYYCTSLTTPPSLPAMTLANWCYNAMFYNCTSLATAPALQATTLANYCYESMFSGCTALTTAPALPATTLYSNCYNSMFKWCSSLNSVTIYANDISATRCLEDWLQDVAASGTFHNLGSATYTSGTSGIPSGWTEVHS